MEGPASAARVGLRNGFSFPLPQSSPRFRRTQASFLSPSQVSCGRRTTENSDNRERPVRRRTALDPDRIAGTNLARRQHNGHDAGFAHEISCGITVEGSCHQALLNLVKLGTRVAQSGHLDDRAVADVEASPGSETEQIDTQSRDILAHLSGLDWKASLP